MPRRLPNLPARDGGRAVVVGQDGLVLARFVKRDMAVRLCGDVHKGRSVGVFGEEVFVVGEVPFLETVCVCVGVRETERS